MDPQNHKNTTPSSGGPHQDKQRDATVDLIRGQIGRLFGDPDPAASSQPGNTAPAQPTQPRQAGASVSAPQRPEFTANTPTRPAPSTTTSSQGPQRNTQNTSPNQSSSTYTSPYERTQQNTGTVSEDQWRSYHSSWQQYYQKYYERYYMQSLAHERAKHYEEKEKLQAQSAPATTSPYFETAHSDPAQVSADTSNETMSKKQAVKELRNQIRDRVSTSAEKVRKSRHFLPIAAAVGVLLIFLFLQYNRVLFAAVEAYVAPGSANPADIIVDPNSTEATGDEPQLIIPKINVSVPVVYENTMGSSNQETHKLQMKAMEKGIAWFGVPGADSKPGQKGNTVLSGHSSNDVVDPGEYKFIFARLDKLKKDDTIYLNYEGTRYTYTVTGTEVVKPNNLKALQTGTDKPTLTLITCTPLGTALNRLLVHADQVSPDPGKASDAEDFDEDDADSADMPGNSPKMLQRIFGGN